MAATANQIEEYATYWRSQALEALATEQPTLVALGDSLAQGVGASSPTLGYVGQLLAQLPGDGAKPPVLNLSRSGAAIRDVIDTQLPALAEAGINAHWIVCTVGSNDLVRSPRFWKLRDHANELVEKLPADTILATAPARGSLLAKFLNSCLVRAARDRPVVVVDVNARLTTWRGHRAADRFHPNDAGYLIWAATFAPFLTRTADPGMAERSG